MKDAGELLYEMYCECFATVFAPKWKELSEASREGWGLLELRFTRDVIRATRTVLKDREHRRGLR